MPSEVPLVVAYPSKHPETGEPLNFNMEYYLAGHMPLIEDAWGPYGLKSWSINEFQNPNPISGEAPPYLVQTTLNFDTLENFQRALKMEYERTAPDVEKFSNVFPVIWAGETVKTATVKSVGK